MDSIYLDHNATTPIRPEVVEAMDRAWRLAVGNAASQHQFGQAARRLVEESRERIAELLLQRQRDELLQQWREEAQVKVDAWEKANKHAAGGS